MDDPAPTRESLMERHREALRRRSQAATGTPEYEHAAEEIARIEVAIAAVEELPPADPDARPESAAAGTESR